MGKDRQERSCRELSVPAADRWAIALAANREPLKSRADRG